MDRDQRAVTLYPVDDEQEPAGSCCEPDAVSTCPAFGVRYVNASFETPTFDPGVSCRRAPVGSNMLLSHIYVPSKAKIYTSFDGLINLRSGHST